MKKGVKSKRAPKMTEAEVCALPSPVSSNLLHKFVVPEAEHETRNIQQYVNGQAGDEKILHLEKIKSEPLHGERMDVWDVHTDKNRWWVITKPLMNLYSQSHFPSLDYVMSFHIGLMTRLSERDGRAPSEDRLRIAAAWRKVDQASDALETANEAEEFQAVGMRCREALLAFVKAAVTTKMIKQKNSPPKAGDFVQLSELLAETIAGGRKNEALRGYLKSIARSSWQLVSWLTHTTSAVRDDAVIALGATNTVLGSFTTALMRFESGMPERCPKCSSYRLTSVYRPDLDIEQPYIVLCESCNWENSPQQE